MSELWAVLGASAGGLFPALVWLWFWIREDSEHPEPRRLIALAFFAGAVAVGIVIPIEKSIAAYIASRPALSASVGIRAEPLTLILWSGVEEIIKLLAAAATVLWRREDDEPIDPVIYMVAVALGFAAVENALFLLSPLSGFTLAETIITGDYRFVGANLLHILASATIGGALALSFYRSRWIRGLSLAAGVILAICLHGAFNILIMTAEPQQILQTFSIVWAGLIALIAFLELVKRMPRRA